MLYTIRQQIVQLLACCIILLYCAGLSSCKKDGTITGADAKISTSTEALKFDTVFTSIGSVTQSFKINNLNDQKLILSSVKLGGGEQSPFKININGTPSSSVSNLEIAANDSVYVFVTVNIDPNFSNLPFLVQDSVEIKYNGNTRFVQLEAYGQNANFLRNAIIKEDRTWNNRLPYVILGSLQVDTNVTLTLDPGVKIYAHATAPILIDGTLIANGTKEDPVLFTGDRLDEDYKDLPASWPGIYFREFSKDNHLTFTNIKNAYRGVIAEYPASNGNAKVTMQQCIVDNAYDAGLMFVASSFDINNSLISNCGNNINIILGGDYRLTNCTVAGFSSYVNHTNPVLIANNYAEVGGNNVSSSLNAIFENCIFWGEETNLVTDEAVILKRGSDPFNVSFNNCLYRNTTDPANSVISESILNIDPMFDSTDYSKKIFDFHISNPAGPGINKGKATTYSKDLDNNSRSVGLPDLGCFEQQ